MANKYGWTTRTAHVVTGTVERSFGPDSRGRTIGARVHLLNETFVPAADDATSGYSVPAGSYFSFVPGATRNGEHYGAGQPEQRFATEAERDAAVAKYFVGAEKRAAKKSAEAAPVAQAPAEEEIVDLAAHDATIYDREPAAEQAEEPVDAEALLDHEKLARAMTKVTGARGEEEREVWEREIRWAERQRRALGIFTRPQVRKTVA